MALDLEIRDCRGVILDRVPVLVAKGPTTDPLGAPSLSGPWTRNIRRRKTTTEVFYAVHSEAPESQRVSQVWERFV